MNYLAHTLLSPKNIDYQIANLLADPLKGKPWSGCRSAHRQGLAMHKSIDRFTDNHPYFLQAKQRLGAGYLKGVVLDILFDHFLSQHWDYFVQISLHDFSERFYSEAAQVIPSLPKAGQGFMRRVIQYDFFHLYHAVEDLEKVYHKFDLRLSERVLAKECASDYLPLIKANYSSLESDFLKFFPLLVQYVVCSSQLSPSEYYFKMLPEYA